MIVGLAAYGWWIAGLLLLGLEIVAPGVYFLFFGIAALVIGMNGFLMPNLGLTAEIVGFLVVSAATVLLGHRWYRARIGAGPGSLHRRTDRLIGRTGSVIEAIGPGGGRVAVEDGGWQAEGPALAAGTPVRIVGARGSVLIVEPLSGPAAETTAT